MKLGVVYEVRVPNRKKPVKMVLTRGEYLYKENFHFQALNLKDAGKLYYLSNEETSQKITR